MGRRPRRADSERYPALAGIVEQFLDAGVRARARATLLRRGLAVTLAILPVTAVSAAALAKRARNDVALQRDAAVSRHLVVHSASINDDPRPCRAARGGGLAHQSHG
ncbi:hypothetical protein [Sphaerisporangium dianthi]|uniref:Uncharacterized protein n=1 Tax=Sphaerisporangium dianthi TaxID=1436120 RepID=A0ABV9CJR8_9ACTN